MSLEYIYAWKLKASRYSSSLGPACSPIPLPLENLVIKKGGRRGRVILPPFFY